MKIIFSSILAIFAVSANALAFDENTFIDLAKQVNPAVVSVSVSFHARGSVYRDPVLEMFEQFMGPQFRPPREQGQQEAQSVGTGFVIEADGLAVTNNHVINGADEVKVAFVNQPGKFFDAVVIGQDPRTDIALIKIKGAGKLPTVKLGNSKNVQVGQWVAAFGNPYGHTFSMSKGIVSALGRQIRELNAVPFIQTDASINPGNSGGPLVNTSGEVVGVNSAIDARAQGIGFAIPIDYVKDLIPQLKANGRVVRGFLGVTIDEVSPRAKAALNLPVDSGALVMNVFEQSPAAKAGLQPYDVVVQFGDKKIEKAQDLMDAVADTKIGDSAEATLFREGKKKTIKVSVAEPPDAKAQNARVKPRQAEEGSSGTEAFGFSVSDWTEKRARDFGIPQGTPKLPIVVGVERGSPAALAGLRPGDLVLDVNRYKVTNATDVAKRLVAGANMIRVQNGNQVSIIFLNLR